MKKFRFLVFMLILTSIFIGCAQPTDDTVIPEVPKTTTEENKVLTINERLYKAGYFGTCQGKLFFKKTICLNERNYKITTNTFSTGSFIYTGIISPNGDKISIDEVTESLVGIVVFDRDISCFKEIITENIEQVYIEDK